MTSAMKISANRRNALASTGPRTPRGKAMIAGNALKHGMMAQAILVLPGENPAAWAAFCDEVVHDLRADGVAQQALAERYALNLWRLRRGPAFEAAQASARIKLAAVLTKEEKQVAAATRALAAVKDWPRQCRQAEALVTQVLDAPPSMVDGDAADKFIGLVLTALKLEEFEHFSVDLLTAMGFDCPAREAANLDPYTQSEWETVALRKGFDFLIGHSGQSPEAARVLLGQATQLPQEYAARLRRAQRELQEAQTKLEEQQQAYAALHAVPPLEELERLERYERHLAKQCQHALAELQRLQEMQRGEPVPPLPRADLRFPDSRGPLPLGLRVEA